MVDDRLSITQILEPLNPGTKLARIKYRLACRALLECKGRNIWQKTRVLMLASVTCVQEARSLQ